MLEIPHLLNKGDSILYTTLNVISLKQNLSKLSYFYEHHLYKNGLEIMVLSHIRGSTLNRFGIMEFLVKFDTVMPG